MAYGLIQQASSGFSSGVFFSDPQNSKSSRLDGAGLRLGTVGAEELRSVVVARNVGNTDTVISGSIPYTNRDGTTGAAAIPNTYLAPGETTIVNLSGPTSLNPLNVSAAGLQFQYSTAPGTVVVSAMSVSQSNNQVFRVPLLDAAAQQSATGGYPWFIDGSSSTIIYIKNVTDGPQSYVLQLDFAGGVYAPGLKTMEAGQTAAIDVRALRDNQTPDARGRTIPANATSGQVHWSVHGGENLVLIGRAEQADITAGISSSYACQNCCPDSFYSSACTPDSVTGFPGDTNQFTALQRDTSCYGTIQDYYPISTFDWFSFDTTVATVDSNGLATAQNPGSTRIQTQWYANGFTYEPVNDSCKSTLQQVVASALCDVGPRINGPTTLWWFHGETPTGYATQITLTTSCSGTSWQWTVTSGANKVTLGTNGSCSITVTSAASSGTEGDVAITVTVAGITSDAYHLTVRAPYDLLPDIVTHQSDANFAYITHINYTIRDQFTTQLPSGVPINEQWTTGVVTDYSGMNWRRGNPTGFSASIAYFADIIQGELPSSTPTPSAPTSPLGTTAVYHWGQDWYIGSTSPGFGRRVQSNTLQKYTDHATHENIVSPNP